MKIKIIGSGGAFDEISTSFLLDNTILIDCGETVVNQLVKSKEIINIKDIFITHVHQDHVGGLEKFIYYRQIMEGFNKKINVTIHCNNEVYKYFKTLAVSKDPFNKGKEYEPVYFNILKINNYTDNYIKFKEYKINYFEVVHMKNSINCFGYFVSFFDNRKSVFFTGDMDSVHPKITKKIVEESLIFHDMGWTGIPISDRKFHPTEKEVFQKYGYSKNIIGVHTSQKLKYYRKAKNGELFIVK